MHARAMKAKKGDQIPLGLEVQTVVSFRVRVGAQTWEGQLCSSLLNLLPSPYAIP